VPGWTEPGPMLAHDRQSWLAGGLLLVVAGAGAALMATAAASMAKGDPLVPGGPPADLVLVEHMRPPVLAASGPPTPIPEQRHTVVTKPGISLASYPAHQRAGPLPSQGGNRHVARCSYDRRREVA
jgi:hypothetical protein